MKSREDRIASTLSHGAPFLREHPEKHASERANQSCIRKIAALGTWVFFRLVGLARARGVSASHRIASDGIASTLSHGAPFLL